jgi:hypothetical protein
MKHAYIRPQQAWSPHWVEDTSFQACAPQSYPNVLDPPLHFAKDTNKNVTWCAEIYPTQNPNISKIDTITDNAYTGTVKPFTSHVSLNSSSPACTYTSLQYWLDQLQISYPGAGLARHAGNTTTCDRTAIAKDVTWASFPLLAPAADVEAAMTADKSSYGSGISSYGCLVTYDAGGAKTLKTSPTAGCCGNTVQMTTGTTGNANAHLEPGTTCMTPDY